MDVSIFRQPATRNLQPLRLGVLISTERATSNSLVAAEFGLDPTEVALINDGCQGHDWNWITQYQKENGFPQRHSLKEVIKLGKDAIEWDREMDPRLSHNPGKGPQIPREYLINFCRASKFSPLQKFLDLAAI